MSVDAYWDELVTTALLGTDRREPPDPPAGPLADVVADAVRPTPSQRMLTSVAATVAARRAGFVPGRPADRLAPPPPDPRPTCPGAAVDTLRYVMAEWPVLEDEWVLEVLRLGWRLPPDALVPLLLRYRRDVVRRARVAVAAGPLAAWVCEHVPALAPAAAGTAPADAVESLPELAISPDLAELLRADARTFVRRLAPAFDAGRFGPSHRAVLIHLLARCRPEVLDAAAQALAATDSMAPAAGLALSLSDLARTRSTMLSQLRSAGGDAATAPLTK